MGKWGYLDTYVYIAILSRTLLPISIPSFYPYSGQLCKNLDNILGKERYSWRLAWQEKDGKCPYLGTFQVHLWATTFPPAGI